MIYKNLDIINSLGFKNIDIYINPYILITDINNKITIYIITYTKKSEDIIFVVDTLSDRRNLYAEYTSSISSEYDLYIELNKYFLHDIRKIKIEKLLK
jgi:hypothetical protein